MVDDSDREGYYKSLTQLQPTAAEPWYQLGNLYAQRDDLEAAEHAYRQALRRADRVDALHNLGLVQMRMGIQALRVADARLPADDPVRQQTRDFLRTLSTEGL